MFLYIVLYVQYTIKIDYLGKNHFLSLIPFSATLSERTLRSSLTHTLHGSFVLALLKDCAMPTGKINHGNSGEGECLCYSLCLCLPTAQYGTVDYTLKQKNTHHYNQEDPLKAP